MCIDILRWPKSISSRSSIGFYVNYREIQSQSDRSTQKFYKFVASPVSGSNRFRRKDGVFALGNLRLTPSCLTGYRDPRGSDEGMKRIDYDMYTGWNFSREKIACTGWKDEGMKVSDEKIRVVRMKRIRDEIFGMKNIGVVQMKRRRMKYCRPSWRAKSIGRQTNKLACVICLTADLLPQMSNNKSWTTTASCFILPANAETKFHHSQRAI